MQPTDDVQTNPVELICVVGFNRSPTDEDLLQLAAEPWFPPHKDVIVNASRWPIDDRPTSEEDTGICALAIARTEGQRRGRQYDLSKVTYRLVRDLLVVTIWRAQPSAERYTLKMQGREYTGTRNESEFQTLCLTRGAAALRVSYAGYKGVIDRLATHFLEKLGSGAPGADVFRLKRLVCPGCKALLPDSYTLALQCRSESGEVDEEWLGFVGERARSFAYSAKCPRCGSSEGWLIYDQHRPVEVALSATAHHEPSESTMRVNRLRAREQAERWWVGSAGRGRSSATCDRCGAAIARGEGYLCLPSEYQSSGGDVDVAKLEKELAAMLSAISSMSPDLLCESCFSRHAPQPWTGEA